MATIKMVVRTWWHRVSLGGGAVTCIGQVIRSREKITCLLHYNIKEIFKSILDKYIFKKLIMKLFKYCNIKKYTIKLKIGK